MTDFEISLFQKAVQISIATEAEFKPVRGDPYRFEDSLPGGLGLDPLLHGIPRTGPRRRGPADGRARGPADGRARPPRATVGRRRLRPEGKPSNITEMNLMNPNKPQILVKSLNHFN